MKVYAKEMEKRAQSSMNTTKKSWFRKTFTEGEDTGRLDSAKRMKSHHALIRSTVE